MSGIKKYGIPALLVFVAVWLTIMVQRSCTDPAADAFKAKYEKQVSENESLLKQHEAERTKATVALEQAKAEANEAKAKLDLLSAVKAKVKTIVRQDVTNDCPQKYNLLWKDYQERVDRFNNLLLELDLCKDYASKEKKKFDILEPMYTTALSDIDTLKNTVELHTTMIDLNNKLHKRKVYRTWFKGMLVGVVVGGTAALLLRR